MMSTQHKSEEYAGQLAIQMRKGTLAYCVLVICSRDPLYTNDVVKRLRSAHILAVEGSIYALLSRLHKDGLLTHEWKEAGQGPPRKYYQITPLGSDVLTALRPHIATLRTALEIVEKG